MRYIAEDATLRFKFTTRQFSTGAPFTLAGTPSLSVYPEDSLTQITTGITLTADYDSVTGMNQVVIDLSASASYTAGKAYQVVIAAGTVDSVSVVGEVVYEFYIHASGGLEALITRGLLALPAVAAGGAGGLPTDSTGKTSFNDIAATAVVSGGAITTSGGAVSNVTTVATLTGHTAQTGDSYARLGAPAGASVSADIAAVKAETASILDDTGTSGVLLAATATSAQLVDDVWDEVITGGAHNVTNSAAKFLRESAEAIGVTGTAQAGAAGTITLAAAASATDDLYNGERIALIEGTGAGQSRLVIDYNGTTKVATVDRNWTTNPSTDTVYSISGADADVRAIEGSNTAADNFLAMYDGTGYAGGTINLQADAVAISGDATAADNLEAALDGTGGVTITATFSGNLTGSAGSLATQAKADVNAEVLDVLNTDTFAESSGVPAATATLVDKIGWLATLARNKQTQTATTTIVRNDADSGNVATSTISDDGTTFTRGEWT